MPSPKREQRFIVCGLRTDLLVPAGNGIEEQNFEGKRIRRSMTAVYRQRTVFSNDRQRLKRAGRINPEYEYSVERNAVRKCRPLHIASNTRIRSNRMAETLEGSQNLGGKNNTSRLW